MYATDKTPCLTTELFIKAFNEVEKARAAGKLDVGDNGAKGINLIYDILAKHALPAKQIKGMDFGPDEPIITELHPFASKINTSAYLRDAIKDISKN